LWRPEAKSPLRRLGVEGMTILKIDLQELVSEDIDSIDLIHYRDMLLALVNAIMNLLVS